MNELDKKENYTNKTFEDIKHIDENGVEYWYARELQLVLNYKEWRKFENVINKAKESCRNSDITVLEHFVDIDKTIKMPKGATKNIRDYKLTRYACYLIAQNGDTRKKVIALAQTYFAVQTRKQEISEKEYSTLTEDEKRFYQRNLTRKGLRYREDILDNMGSEELAANLFRITQTESRLKRDKVDTENKANKIHYEVGAKIRKTIKELGGTMPEDLPTPSKSLKQLEKENKKSLKK